jgi:hypothetical protein
MDINEFIGLLHTIGVDVNAPVLKNWAYSDNVIEAPKPQGRGSGIRGRSASWNKDDIPNVAAVWAIRHHPTVKYRPMLELVPYITQTTRMPYEMPTAGYDITPPITSYEQIKVKLNACPEPLRERLSDEKWQALLLTWIAAREKAKRGIPLDVPKQIQFHWHKIDVDGGADYVPDEVDNTVKDDKHVSLHDAESGHDEIVIMYDGSDFRKTLFRLVGLI